MNAQPNAITAALQACNECATACLQCASACLQESEPKAMVRCIALDLECADLCRLAAVSMARGDSHHAEVCKLCAKVCRACAAECGSHQMAHCQACAQACQRCAEACEAMAG